MPFYTCIYTMSINVLIDNVVPWNIVQQTCVSVPSHYHYFTPNVVDNSYGIWQLEVRILEINIINLFLEKNIFHFPLHSVLILLDLLMIAVVNILIQNYNIESICNHRTNRLIICFNWRKIKRLGQWQRSYVFNNGHSHTSSRSCRLSISILW